VIMDLQMPEMDGFETTQYIRQDLKLTIPIIAMIVMSFLNFFLKVFRLQQCSY
jgi:CheY-like chemotaxis protein